MKLAHRQHGDSILNDSVTNHPDVAAAFELLKPYQATLVAAARFYVKNSNLIRARERLSSNATTMLANYLVAAAYLLMAFVHQPSIFMIFAALAGTGWTIGASELWVASQRAMPGWARGRLSAIVMMVSQGGIALGGVVWGFSNQAAGSQYYAGYRRPRSGSRSVAGQSFVNQLYGLAQL